MFVPVREGTMDEQVHAYTQTDLLHEEQLRGEQRVNDIRAVALIAFYAQHIISFYYLQDNGISPQFHRTVTLIVAAWFMAIFAIHHVLGRRWMPPYLKYGAALWDLAMCGLLMALGDGPRSGLLILLPLIAAASAVRISLGLVWFSTLGAMLTYLVVLGHYAFIKVGASAYYNTAGMRIPRSQQLIVLIAIGAAGLLAGQACRQARRLLQRTSGEGV